MHDVRTQYSWSDKTKACQLYMLTGNMRVVADQLNINPDTLYSWRKSEWWPTMVAEIRATQRAKTGQRLTDIIQSSLEVVSDRLENGDIVLNNKTGELIRKPVSLKDAATVTNNLMTRQLQMEEIADKMENTSVSVNETLKLLATEFQKWSKRITRDKAQDIDFKEQINAIHEERETGLQEGSGTLHLEAGSEEEEGGAECRTPSTDERRQGAQR